MDYKENILLGEMNMLKTTRIIYIMLGISVIVFIITVAILLRGESLPNSIDLVGVRVATLFVAFASFISSTLFSLLILLHNKTVSKINDDTNQRAELFRELQFSSTNYSIIDFKDQMLIYDESQRYIDRFIKKQSMQFHMITPSIKTEDVYSSPSHYEYISIKIPFKVIEGKMVSSISFKRLKFERDEQIYNFISPTDGSKAFILYNEHTNRNSAIINLILPKDSDFFSEREFNAFSKIKISLTITSLLGVEVKGITELYFTNPTESNHKNIYKINASNFTLIDMPKVTKIHHTETLT